MLHSVAHKVSHQIPAESEVSRQNRATPPQIKVSHLSPDPPPRSVALPLIRNRQGAKGGCRGGAGGGYRGTFGFRKWIALQGVSQLQSHQSRYSVQPSGNSQGHCCLARQKADKKKPSEFLWVGHQHRQQRSSNITNPGTTPITVSAVNSDHGLSFAGEETRTMV